MTRAKRLAPVQTLVDDNERRLAQSLAAFERRVTRERGETRRSWSAIAASTNSSSRSAPASGIGATDLRDYQAFLARLGEAIRQQQALVQRARAERDAERLRWQDAARRAKALGHVVERWQAEERRAADRREQREAMSERNEK